MITLAEVCPGEYFQDKPIPLIPCVCEIYVHISPGIPYFYLPNPDNPTRKPRVAAEYLKGDWWDTRRN